MHGAFNSDDFKGWNQFMSYSMGFFVDDLTQHIKR